MPRCRRMPPGPVRNAPVAHRSEPDQRAILIHRDCRCNQWSSGFLIPRLTELPANLRDSHGETFPKHLS